MRRSRRRPAMCTPPPMSTRTWSMNSGPASPGSRELRSARLLQPQPHAVEQAPQPEFELLGGGSRGQLVGQLDQVRVLHGRQRAVEAAQRQALRRSEASGAEIVHRLLQNRGQYLMGHRRVDVSRQRLIEASLTQNTEGQLPAAQ